MAGGVVDIIEDVVSVVVPPGESMELMVRVVAQSVVDHPNWWDVDLRDKLTRRDNCPHPLENGWWRRSLDQIDGITIHHTLGHDPAMLARGYINKAGGRPSIPYHLWVARSGEVLYCLDLTEGCWHDHTGHENTHVSVGLAGVLDVTPPSAQQIESTIRVVSLLLAEFGLDVDAVHGHRKFFPTRCPGWGDPPFLPWRFELFEGVS